MTEDEFLEAYGREEHERLDFKTGADGLHEVIAAMAMSSGGRVVIGLRERPSPLTFVGVRDPQRAEDAVTTAARQVGVDVETQRERVGGQHMLIVTIPAVPGRVVTTPDGRLLRRAGTQNLPLTGDQFAAFVLGRRQQSAELDSVPAATLEDLDVRRVNRLLVAEGRRRVQGDQLERVLRADRFLDEGGGITKVALLLFSAAPRNRMPAAAVTFARMPTTAGSRHSARRVDLEGDIVAVIQQLDDLLYREMRKEAVVRGLLREEITEYPRPALREAIVNAVAHRDYSLEGAPVDVRMFDDRIEVRSPGGLPGHITLENIRHERFRRNPRLMEALRALRVVEDFGEGIDRMHREMEQRLLGPPRIEATPASVTVTLTNRSLVSFEDLLWLDLLPGAKGLTIDERRVLVLAKGGRPVTNTDVRGLLGVDRDGARRLLSSLVATGLVRQRGHRGGSHYVLSDTAVRSAGLGDPEADDHMADRLLPELVRRGSLTNPDARAILGVDDRAVARRALQWLVARGDATRQGIGRGTFYTPRAEPRQMI